MRGIAWRSDRTVDGGAVGSLRRHIRNSLFAPFAIVVLVMGSGIVRATDSAALTIVLLCGLLAGLAGHGWRILAALRDPTAPVPLSRSVPEALFAVGFTCLAVAVTQETGQAFLALLIGMSGTTLLIGRPARTGWSLIAALTVVGTLAVGAVLSTVPTDTEMPLQAAPVVAILIVGIAAAEYAALRQWVLTLELDRARREADALASTRERLRIAEDLHDMLGHALQVVAFKSELATRLSETDQQRARAEMIEVQQLARGSLHDVRELVKSERAPDLRTEFASVRQLLASAGIDCECAGEPDTLGEWESVLFGRVLREAATNLLRHANPRTCAVTLRVGDGDATLTVRNDGSPKDQQPPDDNGSGLAGLARRVEAAGGTFRAGPGTDPSTFEVHASMPVAATR